MPCTLQARTVIKTSCLRSAILTLFENRWKAKSQVFSKVETKQTQTQTQPKTNTTKKTPSKRGETLRFKNRKSIWNMCVCVCQKPHKKRCRTSSLLYLYLCCNLVQTRILVLSISCLCPLSSWLRVIFPVWAAASKKKLPWVRMRKLGFGDTSTCAAYSLSASFFYRFGKVKVGMWLLDTILNWSNSVKTLKDFYQTTSASLRVQEGRVMVTCSSNDQSRARGWNREHACLTANGKTTFVQRNGRSHNLKNAVLDNK